MIGDLLFTNFAYASSNPLGTDSFYVSGLKGTGVAQNSTNITVLVDAANDKFTFKANWLVDHFQTGTLSLSFTVTAPPSHRIGTLTSLLTETGTGTQNGGPQYTPHATCTGGTCGGTDFTNTTKSPLPTQGPLTISNTVLMNANGNTLTSLNSVHLSLITDQFAQSAPASSVPEPVTYALAGVGIGALAWLRRRKQA
jgi:hypothetical protein